MTSVIAALSAAAGRASVFALGAAAALALRALERGEPVLSHRLTLLIGMALVAALAAGLVGYLVAELLADRWPRWLRALLGGPALAGGFAGALALLFVLLTRILAGSPEDGGDLHGHSALFIDFHDGLGLFLVTGLKYLLPWPLALVALLAGLVAAAPPVRAGAAAR